MASALGRARLAVVAASNAFKLAYSNPAQEQAQSAFDARVAQYNLLWAFYNNSLFDPNEQSWGMFRQRNNLYRYIQPDVNPVTRLVNFYADHIYPGVLSEDGDNLPENVQLAIPLSKDTDKRIKKAIAQFWEWSGWQDLMSVHVLFGAALGSVLVELVDDVERGKIYADVRWPGQVVNLDLDPQNNVKSYTLEYIAIDTNRQQYVYRKEVTKNSFTVYRDGQVVSQTENIYGFVPAIWVKHQNVGGIHGQPAAHGSLNKILRVNNLLSHIVDHEHKVIGAPIMITLANGVANLFGNKKREATEDLDNPDADKETVMMLQSPNASDVKSLAGNLNIADALKTVEVLLAQVQANHPEITFWERIREMDSITGVAAERLSGDVVGKLQKAATLYDRQSKKLFQMALAMGGMRANEGKGGWANPTDQQKKFKPFNLDSYDRGKLEFSIMPRQLLPPTKLERATESLTYWQGLTAELSFGVPKEMILEQEGWTLEDLARMKELKAEAAKEAQQNIGQQPNTFNKQNPFGGNTPNTNNKDNGGTNQ